MENNHNEAGATPRISSGWALRVKQHKKMVHVFDGEAGFVSEISEYTDATDREEEEIEDGATEPLLEGVAETAPLDDMDNFPEFGRFSTVYYNQKGMNPQQIGVIEGCMPIIAGAMQPAWGYVADQTGRRWTVVVVTRVINTSIMMLLAWPAVATGFPNLLAISIAMCLFSSGGILDACTLEVLGPHAKRLYGSLRLWCAVSWGGGAVVMGIINDNFGFDYNFGLYALFLVIQLLTLYVALPKSIRNASRRSEGAGDAQLLNQQQCASSQEEKGGFWGVANAQDGRSSYHLHEALFQRGGALFLAEVLVFGFAMGVIEKGLLFVYLIKDLGASTTLCGAVVGVTVIFELPVFQYSHQILSTIGTQGALLISYATYVIRLVGYTMLTSESIHWIFALEVLHGFTFALLWIAAVAHLHKITPGSWAATMQALLSTAQGSLGQGLGVIAGGSVMQKYGAIYMFQCAAAVGSMLVLWRFCVLVVHVLKPRRDEDGSL